MSRPPAQLYVHDTGAGPAMVMLHGFLASSAYWQPFEPILSPTYRLYMPDLLGFGRSPKPARSRYNYAAHLAALDRTLTQRLGTEQFILVGHSMGALLALRFARLHPERVRALVLLNPPVLKSKREAKREYLGTSLMYRLGLTTGIHRLVWPLYRFATYANLLGASLRTDTEPFRAYVFQHTARSRLRSFRQLILQSNALPDLTAIQVPTLIISSEQDRIRYRNNLNSQQLPSAIQHIVTPGDHHAPIKQTGQVAGLLLDFLQSANKR